MFFDFEEFIQFLREHPDENERKIVEEYEKHYWPIQWDIKEQIWYKEYVSKFKTLSYKIPEEYKEDFDWELLMQLVAASFSSDWLLEFNEWETQPEFLISVTSWDTQIVKKVSELFGFQIKRLYEIYVKEQMSLQNLMAESENDKDYIESQRVSRLERWQRILDKIESEQEKIKEEQEKKKKLEELMSQL